jgi:hypothetical protein
MLNKGEYGSRHPLKLNDKRRQVITIAHTTFEKLSKKLTISEV